MIPALLTNTTMWRALLLISYESGAGYTRKDLQSLTHLDNLSLDLTIKKLLFHKILHKEKRVYYLTFENQETNTLLKIMEDQKKELRYPSYELFLILVELVHALEKKNIEAIYLFGSHAKKTASLHSDIDIAVFSDAHLDLSAEEEKIEEKFGKELQVHSFLTKELEGKSSLIKNILKDGVRLI